MKTLQLLTAVLVCLVLGQVAQAEEQPQPPPYSSYPLGEVVVTVDHAPAVREVGLVTEFSAEEIEATHSLTLPEALAHVPGVVVTTGAKNEPNISVHGFPMQSALLLIDGVPYYETAYGKLNLNQIPTDMIARIDVIKNAPSVLYGANAQVAVINVITKEPGERPFASLTAEASDYSTYHLAAQAGARHGIFSYWLSYTRRDSNGWPLADGFTPKLATITRKPGGTVQAVTEDGGRRNNTDLRTDALWARFGVRPTEGAQYDLNFHYIDSEWGFPPSTNWGQVFTSRPAFSSFARMDNYDDWGVDLSGRQRLTDAVQLRAKLFYHKHYDEYVSFSDQTYTQVIADSNYEDYFVGGALYADWQIAASDTLRAAFHYQGDSHRERDDVYLPLTKNFSWTGSAALENEWRPTERLSVVVGASYDWFQIEKATVNVTDKVTGDFVRQDTLETPGTKDEFNPMIGASYILGDFGTRLFASVARKSRFPTLSQLYSTRGGNPDLTAEHSINYTLGVNQSFWERKGLAELAFFHHDVSDRISRDAPGPVSTYSNYASVQMYGFELTGRVYPIEGLYLDLGYTYNRAFDDSPGRVTDDVVGVPEHTVTASAGYELPRLKTRLDVHVIYASSTFDQLPTAQQPGVPALKTDGFYVLSSRLAQPLGRHFEVFAFVDNLLDENYESEADFPAPGRRVWGGLTARY